MVLCPQKRLAWFDFPILIFFLAAAYAAFGAEPYTARVSISSTGEEANFVSLEQPSISGDGTLVVFSSGATNLVPGGTIGAQHIYLHDYTTGETVLISATVEGNEGDMRSYLPVISGDGRYVAFGSAATNLVAGDTNDADDVFVYDRAAGSMERVSVSPGGGQTAGTVKDTRPAISEDGRFVAFVSGAADVLPGADNNGFRQVYIRDRLNQTTWRVSEDPLGKAGDGDSGSPSLSADGRFVAFESLAGNLVALGVSSHSQIYVYEQSAGISLVSAGLSGGPANGPSRAPVLSGTGDLVVFESDATDLVADDINGASDIFAYDGVGITRLSVSYEGVAGNGTSIFPAVSADGRFVGFHSAADTLVDGDTNQAIDVFVVDRDTGAVERVSVGPQGVQGDGPSGGPALSRDGYMVAFFSEASNLVADDTKGFSDIFIRDRLGLHRSPDPAPSPPPTLGGPSSGGGASGLPVLLMLTAFSILTRRMRARDPVRGRASRG